MDGILIVLLSRAEPSEDISLTHRSRDEMVTISQKTF